MNDHHNAKMKPTRYVEEHLVDELINDFKSAPVVVGPMTIGEALIKLTPALIEAKAKRQSVEALVKICANRGMTVSARQLSRAIRAAESPASTRKATKRKHATSAA